MDKDIVTSILHIAPHYGGGVGTVIRSLISASSGSGRFCHGLAALETLNPRMTSWCHENKIFHLENSWNALSCLFKHMERYDIVHLHWWNHPLINGFLRLPDLPKMRTVLWSHVNGMHAPQFFFKPLINFPDFFVLATPYSRESICLKQLNKTEKTKLRIIRSIADIPAQNEKNTSFEDQFFAGYIGTVDYAKMHKDFISIWEKTGIQNSRLIVCGGPSEKALQKEVLERGVAHLFDIRGQVKDAAPIFSHLKVFVYPLNNTHYGTGEQVLIEAMAFGSVPVVMNNGCEGSLIKNGKTGIIANDTKQFVQAVQYLKNNPQIREKMAAAGKEYVRKRLGIKKNIEQWHRLYKCLLRVEKRTHLLKLIPIKTLPDKSPTSLLMLNSYGFSKTGLLLQSLINSETQWEKEDLCELPPACFATTRGSPFHYRKMLPTDDSLDRVCHILQRLKLLIP